MDLTRVLQRAAAEAAEDVAPDDYFLDLIRELVSIDEVAYELDLVHPLERKDEGWYHFAVSAGNARQAHFLARRLEQHHLQTLTHELYKLQPSRTKWAIPCWCASSASTSWMSTMARPREATGRSTARELAGW